MHKFAKRLGLTINPKEVYHEILNIGAFKQDGVFSRERYQQVVDRFFGSEAALLNEVFLQKLDLQLRKAIEDSGFMLPFELAFKERALKQKRDFRVVKFPVNQFKNQAKISDDVIKNHYDTHRSDFTVPRRVSLQYLQLSRHDLESQITVSEVEAQAFYNKNQDLFKSVRNWNLVKYILPNDLRNESKIAEIKAAILANEKLPSKVVTAKLTLAADDTKQTELVKLVMPLRVGAVAELSTGEKAFFKVVKITEPRLIAFDKVKAQAIQLCKKQKISLALKEQYEKLQNLLYTHPESLRKVAEALNTKLLKTELFAEDTQFKQGILANKTVRTAAFSDTVLQGYNSELLHLNDGSVVVIHLEQTVPKRVKSLSEVAPTIKERLVLTEAEKLAENAARQFLDELNTGKEFTDKEISAQSLQVKNYQEIDLASRAVHSKIIAAAFELPWRSLPKVIATTLKLDDAWVVLQLRRVELSQDDAYDENGRDLNNQIYSGEEFRRFINSTIERAKVKIYTENLELI